MNLYLEVYIEVNTMMDHLCGDDCPLLKKPGWWKGPECAALGDLARDRNGDIHRHRSCIKYAGELSVRSKNNNE